MFYFPGLTLRSKFGAIAFYAIRFPHSDILGSKVARHLPEAYRRHATSFIVVSSLGIRHMLLLFCPGVLILLYCYPAIPYTATTKSGVN